MDGSTVGIPAQDAARALTVAGLAAWVHAHSGQQEQAERCGLLQDLVDTELRRGQPEVVVVPRPVAEEAAGLWEAAAELIERGASVDPRVPRPAEDEQAAGRLRHRADGLRRLLREQAEA